MEMDRAMYVGMDLRARSSSTGLAIVLSSFFLVPNTCNGCISRRSSQWLAEKRGVALIKGYTVCDSSR